MITTIYTRDAEAIKSLIGQLVIPSPDSHKGQNGRVLIVGGSSLFHAASLWAAEVATHFVDMVHYASTTENNEIFLESKRKFRNGIVVSTDQIIEYVKEDDAILIGPGMVRGSGEEGESKYTRDITKQLLAEFSHKKFVIDAGALQMMEPEWLQSLQEKAIITPHQLEFEKLFKTSISQLSRDEKIQVVVDTAKKYNAVILLKAVIDIISDGETTFVVEGGNQGLTKGGSGDTLAGLCTSLYAKNSAVLSATLSSFFVKRTADELFKTKGLYYNTTDLIEKLPSIVSQFAL